MTTNKRPDEAVLPQPSRPQVANSGQRSRPSHLSRLTRYEGGLQPVGFPQRSGSVAVSYMQPAHSCSYRNAAFQALLNAPMFVDFLRAHNRNARTKSCAVKRDCLTCATFDLAGSYWTANRQQNDIEQALFKLWKMCWDVFWGKETSDNTRIGPSHLEEEFYTDAFLMQFLAAMHRQLAAIPSDHQTFSAIFTTHMARRWKCKSSTCNWLGPPHKWESSYFLPIYVQKPHQKKLQTSIIEGLNGGLKMWEQRKLSSRRGSISSSGTCERCGDDVQPLTDLVNLPELLILVRNIEFLNPERDLPDIPYSDRIELRAFTPNRNKVGDQDLRSYDLVSGTVDQQLQRKHPHAVAFARGPRDSGLWYGLNDMAVDPADGLGRIDAQQRPAYPTRNASVSPLLLPEVFIYRRIDHNGWNFEYGADFAPAVTAAIAETHQRNRLIVSRSVNEVFIQRIGQGLLKFKVDLYPADPGPQEIVDFNISLGYELNGNQWAVKLEDALVPLVGPNKNEEKSEPTPFVERAVHRNEMRQQGTGLTPVEAQEERRKFADRSPLPDLSEQQSFSNTQATNPDPSNGASSSYMFHNPFTNNISTKHPTADNDGAAMKDTIEYDDAMDYQTPTYKAAWADTPDIQRYINVKEQQTINEALKRLTGPSKLFKPGKPPQHGNSQDRNRRGRGNQNQNKTDSGNDHQGSSQNGTGNNRGWNWSGNGGNRVNKHQRGRRRRRGRNRVGRT